MKIPLHPLLLSLLATAGLAQDTSGAGCLPLLNGGFDDGLAGWTVQTSKGGFGTHATFEDVEVLDLTAIGGNGPAACLQMFAGATWMPEHPAGSAAQAQVTLVRDAVVRARWLELTVYGEFEPLSFGSLESRFVARVVVSGPGGQRAETVILEDQLDPALACGPGLVGIGVLGGTHRVDLHAAGLRLGDPVRIEVHWSGTVVALNACDDGYVLGTLCVDDVAFCGAHLAPGPTPPHVLRDAARVRTRAEAVRLRAARPARVPLPDPVALVARPRLR